MSDPFDALEALRLPTVPIAPRPEFAAALLRRITGYPDTSAEPATVRYFVDDVDAAVGFYTQVLDFEEELRPSPSFAMLYRGELRLLLSRPGGAHTLPDGTVPTPGGWNRISLRVTDLDTMVSSLRARGAHFQTDITAGAGVDLAVLEDPSGNPIELFAPRGGYHERTKDSTADPTNPSREATP
jgi:catechol 2,3-dioxygenase-like lactoylglutathione lyase family enzyme